MSRLDVELVNRKLAPTRTKAQDLIKNNLVKCNDKIVSKSNYNVEQTDDLSIIENDKLKFVSRAGLKLEKALKEFQIDIKNKVVMDIGSSTGGFTDCAIQNGAKKVIAIDVGTNLMDKKLRINPRVELHEQTNFKDLTNDYFLDLNLIVCDVSFISLKHLIKKIYEQNIKIDFVGLIKPQFECGKEIAKKYKGVILDKAVHLSIIKDLIAFFNQHQFYVENITFSPIKGGDGNIEYLIKISNNITDNAYVDINDVVNIAFQNKG